MYFFAKSENYVDFPDFSFFFAEKMPRREAPRLRNEKNATIRTCQTIACAISSGSCVTQSTSKYAFCSVFKDFQDLHILAREAKVRDEAAREGGGDFRGRERRAEREHRELQGGDRGADEGPRRLSIGPNLETKLK